MTNFTYYRLIVCNLKDFVIYELSFRRYFHTNNNINR